MWNLERMVNYLQGRIRDVEKGCVDAGRRGRGVK